MSSTLIHPKNSRIASSLTRLPARHYTLAQTPAKNMKGQQVGKLDQTCKHPHKNKIKTFILAFLQAVGRNENRDSFYDATMSTPRLINQPFLTATPCQRRRKTKWTLTPKLLTRWRESKPISCKQG